MTYGYEYAYTPASAFSADVNVLPSLRTVLETEFSGFSWTGKEAKINAVEIRAASTFTVSLNAGTTLEAKPEDSDYVVRFTGSIAYMVFDAQTTPTYMWFDWNPGRKDHNVVTFTAVSGSTITVADTWGNAVIVCDTDKYELQQGMYVVGATLSGYDDYEELINYDMQNTIAISGQTATPYTITFAVTDGTDPIADATIVVLDANSAEVAPTANPYVYVLPNSAVAGNYSYTVSKAGYGDGTGTLTVSADATESVALVAEQGA